MIRSLILVALTSLIANACLLQAQTQSKPSRDVILKAFQKLKSDSDRISAARGDGPAPRWGAVSINGGEIVNSTNANTEAAQTIIKIWAVPLDPDGGLTNRKVNLSQYRWSPGEKFALFFNSAVPVRVGLWEEYDLINGVAKKPVQILPTPKYQESYKAIAHGKDVRFPFNIVLDNHNNDELMGLVIVADGAVQNLTLPNNGGGGGNNGGGGSITATQHTSYSDTLNKKAIDARSKAPLKTASRDGETESSDNADDVAIIGYGRENFGYIQIRLKKRN